MIKNLLSIFIVGFFIYACNSGNEKKDTTKLDYSEIVAKDFIKKYPNPDSIHWVGVPNHFSWQAGYIMFAMEKMWKYSGDSAYYNYIRKYVDQQVDENGNIPDFKNNSLDNFLPGYAILFMYEQTKLEKYKLAATNVRKGFNTYPRASNGLFFHTTEDWGKEQVWVDGVFMGQIFLARYGHVIADSTAFDEVVKQMTLILDKCQKSNGLLLHGWNENKTSSWADKNTGLAPEVWSEGLGWFAVLIADVFDYLPENYGGNEKLKEALQKLCKGLKEAQDPKTGMWCQVVDKCDQPGNWNETSGTGMFIYLIQKSIEKGFISKEEFAPVVQKAYHGIIKKAIKNKKGFMDLIDCSSIGIMNNYMEYIKQPKEISPFAAFGSFIIGTSIFERSQQVDL
jgi:rhamnogalacturonyl hydrolase YesR